MISLRNVFKSYGTLSVIDNVSMEIQSNVIYGIIGKSGAGKSTLIKLMSLLEDPDAGEVHFDSVRVDNLKGSGLLECRHQLGMIFQNFNLFSSRDVFGNVAYPLEIVGKDKETIRDRVHELLELVGLSDKSAYPISKLSGGQKQRVAIARALANRPKFLFCDEATSALDPQTTKSILQLIRDIRNKIGLTVVMITHQMEVVKEICDYVSVIDGGKIIENGTLKSLVSFPHTQIAREFISTLEPLEENVLKKLHPNSIMCRLHFGSESVMEPILSKVIKSCQLDVNILSGTLRTVNDEPIGELVVELMGSVENLNSAIDVLKSYGIMIEVLHG
ncbi:methionine import ATP-binding protein MetN [Alphaproteobacteria bacterium]|nr:methionine import ATP-binding protein MetN [Alphaproteobacteria bacterium]